jgi:RNA polymerase sigma-70 factor (ECF subfamily)
VRLAIAVLDHDAGTEPSAPAVTTSMDAVLVTRAAGGDPLAFRRLYERHSPRLYRFLCDLLRDAPAAEEALQETFVRAHGKLASLRDPEKVRPWLYGIARLVVMETRRARRGLESLDDDDADVLEPSSSRTPEQALLGQETGRALGVALESLKPDRRAALLLQADHELPYDEIAEIMGWSLAKVKVEIHRARAQLRVSMAKHLGGNS